MEDDCSTMSKLDFEGRVAVVTGAGRGIGRSHALLLASRGATVVVNDLGVDVRGEDASGDPAREVVEEITRAGGKALIDTASVATEDGCREVITRTVDQFGRIDVLVHNAGRNLGAFEDIMAVHVGGAHWLTDFAFPAMVEQGHGRIVLTTSAAGLYGDGTGPGPNPKLPYATAKAALIGLTKALAMRGAPADIKANAVSPTANTRLVPLNRSITNTRPGAPPASATVDWVAANAPASLVAAGALWLMHQTCPVSGRVFAVGAGRVAEVFIGVTRGYIGGPELDPDAVPDHLHDVGNLTGHHIPVDLSDYAKWVRSLITENS
jgi:NAD(P)-dependent dehydrogenase (short-subunit alcohol dehydrogenase family)